MHSRNDDFIDQCWVYRERPSEASVVYFGGHERDELVGILAAITMSFGFSGMLAYLPTYLQSAGSLSAAESGLIMLMPTVPVLFMPAIGARLINEGARAPTVILSASAILAPGNAWLTTLHPDIGALSLFGPLTMIGTGMGMASGIIDAQAMNHIDQSRTGMAAGLLNTVRGTAQALVLVFFGSALITAVTVQLDSADLAGEVATGNIPPEDHLYLSVQLMPGRPSSGSSAPSAPSPRSPYFSSCATLKKLPPPPQPSPIHAITE